jgi:hypothetical protein
MRLPIWFVVKERDGDHPRSIPCNDAGAAIGFTTTDKLTSFLKSQRGEGTLNVVTGPDELLLLAADLHRQGTGQLCLDPDRNGSDGRVLSLCEIIDFARREGDECWGHRRLSK